MMNEDYRRTALDDAIFTFYIASIILIINSLLAIMTCSLFPCNPLPVVLDSMFLGIIFFLVSFFLMITGCIQDKKPSNCQGQEFPHPDIARLEELLILFAEHSPSWNKITKRIKKLQKRNEILRDPDQIRYRILHEHEHERRKAFLAPFSRDVKILVKKAEDERITRKEFRAELERLKIEGNVFDLNNTTKPPKEDDSIER